MSGYLIDPTRGFNDMKRPWYLVKAQRKNGPMYCGYYLFTNLDETEYVAIRELGLKAVTRETKQLDANDVLFAKDFPGIVEAVQLKRNAEKLAR